MDKMTYYEAALIIDNLGNSDRNQWEMARQIIRATFQIMSKKQLKVTDILSLPWDENTQNEEPDEQEVERVKRLAKSLEGKINLD